jgi:hypothetical protein
MTALMLIFRVKRPEIDEICCNSSYLCVNWWDSIKYKQTSYIVQSIWERLVANYQKKNIYVNGWTLFQIQTSEMCNNIIVIKDEACPSKISHKFNKQCLFNFLKNMRPILVINKYPPFWTLRFWSTALVYHLLEYQLLYFFLSYWHITLFHIHSLLILKHISLYLSKNI